jgi:alpha-glucosidase
MPGFMPGVLNRVQQIPKSGWPALVLSNHDLFRHANRFPFSVMSDEKMKLKAALLLLLKGTPVLYYGDEAGMGNVRLKKRI